MSDPPATHTPGPWTAKTGRQSWGGPLAPTVCAGKVRLATVDGDHTIYLPDGSDRDLDAEFARRDADCRLMAAAPDLLAALKGMVNAYELECGDTPELAAARDAIYRAESD